VARDHLNNNKYQPFQWPNLATPSTQDVGINPLIACSVSSSQIKFRWNIGFKAASSFNRNRTHLYNGYKRGWPSARLSLKKQLSSVWLSGAPWACRPPHCLDLL
jgi:hypothetical protein